MLVLGINSAFHESSACLVEDGNILATVEEERFNRYKHGKQARVDNPDTLPYHSIAYCLSEGDADFSDIDRVAYSFDPDLRRRNFETAEDCDHEGWWSETGETTFYDKVTDIPRLLDEKFRMESVEFNWVSHHRSHAASAFYPSPFREAAVLVVDGTGEYESTSLFSGTGSDLTRIDEYDVTDSIGFLWEMMCKLLGFTTYDAGKVMALASYGDSSEYYDTFREIVNVHDADYSIAGEGFHAGVAQPIETLENHFDYSRDEDEEIGQTDMDIAAGLQKITEDVLLSLLDRLYASTDTKNLCLAGGVALNCVANAKMRKEGPFENVYVQPAAHDAGTALGAAFEVLDSTSRSDDAELMDHVFYGPAYENDDIRNFLETEGVSYRKPDDLVETVAGYLADAKIVAWFQGRLEFGPRALGNRSILADPRRAEIRDVINEKVKHREWFRPFAPSVLMERADEWFAIPDHSLTTEFMLYAYDVKESRKDEVPAIVHTDGTSRLQAVRKEANRQYYELIAAFEERTGVPLLLNTSFNDQEPIVCDPEDALETFQQTRIDYLVVEDFLVSRSDLQ